MLVELTYACKMGCSHCMSDCKPDGKLLQAKYARIHGYENYSFLKISYQNNQSNRRRKRDLYHF